MLKLLKRHRLARKGLSCGKTRSLGEGSSFAGWVDCNPLVRWLLMLLTGIFVFRIASWKGGADPADLAILSFMVVAVSAIVVYLSVLDIWKRNLLLLLFLGCLLVNFFLNQAYFLHGNKFRVFEIPIPALLVPAALAPMLTTILLSPTAGFVSAFLISLLGVLFVSESPGVFLSSLLTGFAAAHFCQHIRRRGDLLLAGLKVGSVGLLCAVILGFREDVSHIGYFIGLQAASAILLGILTALVVGAILPVLEWLFDRIADISWVELSDLKHPLLQRLAQEAPGTYHHSLNVAQLAEAAAEAIGANATQCRVCACFHDVGKLVKPGYFIENLDPEENPHDSLSPNMSALIIISHVKEGVDLAVKHGLRQPIINVIREHHGTSLVSYFYHRALQQQEDARAGGKIMNLREEDVPEVSGEQFRYPGPIPQCKESAIVSLADAIESASRSLKNPTAQKVESLVREIIDQRVEEDQFEDSGLTFNDVVLISRSFTSTLKNMLHARIEYPKSEKITESSTLLSRREKSAAGDPSAQPATPHPPQPQGL